MKLFIPTILAVLCAALATRAEETPPAVAQGAPPSPAPESIALKATDKDGLKAAIGKTAKVTGKVQRANAWDGGITFLNLEGGFTVVCFKKNYGKFPSPPDQLYSQGKSIEVTGQVRLHKDRPEIEITGPDQIKVVADAPADAAKPAAPATDTPKEDAKPAGEKKAEGA